MNGAGKLLAVRVIRSSGSDKAALETLRRAQPLPAVPKALPDEIELALPVAFYLRRLREEVRIGTELTA